MWPHKESTLTLALTDVTAEIDLAKWGNVISHYVKTTYVASHRVLAFEAVSVKRNKERIRQLERLYACVPDGEI